MEGFHNLANSHTTLFLMPDYYGITGHFLEGIIAPYGCLVMGKTDLGKGALYERRHPHNHESGYT